MALDGLLQVTLEVPGTQQPKDLIPSGLKFSACNFSET